jgi:Putative bacterial sensory transduction regulator
MNDIEGINQEVEEFENSNQGEDNGLRAFSTLGDFLQADAWNPELLEDKQAYKIQFESKIGVGTAYAQIFLGLEQFVFYIMNPVKVPEELRPTVAEYITRVNYGLRVGNFELDYEDGEVRYKSCIDFEGETLTNGYIRNTIYPALKTIDRYLPGLMKVIYGSKTPVEAITEIEGDEDE